MAIANGKKIISCGKVISDVPHLINADGQYLYCKYWEPEGPPSCLIFLAHGYGAHCATFNQLAEQFNSIGAYVFSHDHIGHGESEGEGWYVTDYNILTRDVLHHIDEVRKRYENVPLFLFGHSLGGCVAMLSALERPNLFRGVIITGGCMIPDPNTATPFRLFLLRNVAWLFPKMKLMPLDSEYLSRDKNAVRIGEQDPLIMHQGMIVRTAQTVIDISERSRQAMEEIQYPLLIVHGGDDKITNPEGSQMLYQKAKSKDKTLKILPGMYHNLHQEIMEDRLMYFDLVTSWVRDRLD